MSAVLLVETAMFDGFRAFWRTLFPPFITPEFEENLVKSADETRIAAFQVEKAFEGIANKAVAAGQDPLAVLIHEVKGASFRRRLEGEVGPLC